MVRRSSLAALAWLALAAAGTDLRAEVAVRTDSAGNYLGTEVVTTSLRGEPLIWGLRGRLSRTVKVLNPRGDQNGDLWPVIVESNQGPAYPWVVWSRFNGRDYDLAWSRWTSKGWRPVEPIRLGQANGDDLDPDLAFDADGQAYLAWAREEHGSFGVYVSVWLKSNWMSPVLVSEPGVESRYPVIVGFEDNAVMIEFSTAAGLELQRVAFSAPGTITDDINPRQPLQTIGTPIYSGGDSSATRDDR